jgi:hypothetical protein
LSAWTVARAAIEMYLLKLEKMAHSISLRFSYESILLKPHVRPARDIFSDLGGLVGRKLKYVGQVGFKPHRRT